MSEERQRAIETLKEHLAHWERLLKEHICDETVGKNTIEAFKMSIASLETDEAYQLEHEQPEFCGDCISRKDTIEYLKQVTVTDGITFETGFKQILLDIENMPSVLPKAKWIPVTEKLPHDRDWYLGIFKEPDTGWINPLPYICDYVGRETKATTKEYWILRGFTDIDEPCDYYLNLECVAWMPLPEPYEL